MALPVLSGIVYPPELVPPILKRGEVILESPGYEEIMEEGRKEGREQTLREKILTLLTRCLGAVPEELAAQVRQVKDAERLEALFRCAVVVDEVVAFAQELES